MAQKISEQEKNLADAMASPDVSKIDVLRRIRDLTADQEFVLADTWRRLSLDGSLEAWRRLESYKLLLHRCLSYPCSRDEFVREAVTSMGIDEGLIVDMTRASAVPVERREGNSILMVNLPIRTHLGLAAVYFTTPRGSNVVEQAEMYPDAEALDAP